MLIFSFHLTLCSDSSNGLHLSQIDSQPLWVPIHCAPAADSFVVVIIFKIKTSVACQRPPAATWEKNNVKRNNRWCSTAFCTFELRALSERLQRTNYKATASPSSDELLTKIQSLLKKKNSQLPHLSSECKSGTFFRAFRQTKNSRLSPRLHSSSTNHEFLFSHLDLARLRQ